MVYNYVVIIFHNSLAHSNFNLIIFQLKKKKKRARLRRDLEVLVQNADPKLFLLQSHSWLFVVIRGYSEFPLFAKFLAVCGNSWLFVPRMCGNIWG
jgi:hypothetical protein